MTCQFLYVSAVKRVRTSAPCVAKLRPLLYSVRWHPQLSSFFLLSALRGCCCCTVPQLVVYIRLVVQFARGGSTYPRCTFVWWCSFRIVLSLDVKREDLSLIICLSSAFVVLPSGELVALFCASLRRASH